MRRIRGAAGIGRNAGCIGRRAAFTSGGARIGRSPALSAAASTPRTSPDIRPDEAPGLTPAERSAFDELSRQLTSLINEADARAQQTANTNKPAVTDQTRPFLDRLPIGVLVYRLSHLLYANTAFLDWAGSESLDALAEAGGLDSLMIESGDIAIEEGGRKSFEIASMNDEKRVAEARLLQVPWDGELAFALLTMPPGEDAGAKATLDAARAQASEITAILDTATDGVIILDRAACIVSVNRSAEALFGYDADELEGRSFADLFAPESTAPRSTIWSGCRGRASRRCSTTATR